MSSFILLIILFFSSWNEEEPRYPLDKAILPSVQLDDLDGSQDLTDEFDAMIGRVGDSHTKTLTTITI